MLQGILRAFGLHKKSITDLGGLDSPTADLLRALAGGASPSIPSVSPAEAIRVPAVEAAIEIPSDALGRTSFSLFERSKDGRRRVTESKIHQLVNKRASRWQSAAQFRSAMFRYVRLYGYGVAHVIRVSGKPHELIPAKPGTVAVTENSQTGELEFKLNGKQGRRPLRREDLFFIHDHSNDGSRFEPAIKRCSTAIQLLRIIDECKWRFFKKGTNIAGILSPKVAMSPNALELAKKVFDEQIGGANGYGQTVLMPSEFELHRLSMTMVDAEINAITNAAILDIARGFNVPAFLLANLDRATWNNAEQQTEAFRSYSLAPWVERFESAYAEALLTPEEQERFYIEGSTAVLQRGETLKQAQIDQILIAARIVNPNEVREQRNLPKYEGGDEFVNPNTMSGPAPSSDGDDKDAK